MSWPESPRSAGRERLLDRAFAWGAALVAGTVAVTGLFVAKIAQAATTNSNGASTSGTYSDDQGGYGGYGGGSGVGPYQNNGPVLGGSHGS